MVSYQFEISDVLVKMLYPSLDAFHPLGSFSATAHARPTLKTFRPLGASTATAHANRHLILQYLCTSSVFSFCQE
jgi:hypothetical protein